MGVVITILLLLLGALLVCLLIAVIRTLALPKKQTSFSLSEDTARIDNYSEKYIRIYIHPILNSLKQVHLSVLIGALKSTLTIRSEEEKFKKKYAIKNIILPLSKRDYYAAIAVFPSFY